MNEIDIYYARHYPTKIKTTEANKQNKQNKSNQIGVITTCLVFNSHFHCHVQPFFASISVFELNMGFLKIKAPAYHLHIYRYTLTQLNRSTFSQKQINPDNLFIFIYTHTHTHIWSFFLNDTNKPHN